MPTRGAGVLAAVLAIAERGQRQRHHHRSHFAGILDRIAAGFVAFIVPGSVLLVLWNILDPLIVIEDLRVFPPCSWRGSCGPAFCSPVVVAIPTLLEDAPPCSRGSRGTSSLVRVPVDALATLVLGGVIEVTLAHALIADEKRRRESAT